MITIVTDEGEVAVADAEAVGDALWLAGPDAERATGWGATPEGLCKDAMGVPLRPGREAKLVRGARINIAALWRHLGRPVVPESWCIWRQRAGVTELGLAAQPDFWARVDALGDRRYDARIDMPGMP